ncbi:MAG TPA: GNAT family N-acetyltransferase [Natronosporangium sp.]|jgi:GNAT superfamily N-acetyltransferase|nr:GNAT family N-acetyltransferase [Natronosporangium sp.]
MSRRLVNLTLDTLADLPQPCRGCVFWELDPATAQRVCATGDPGLEKEAWLSETLLEWGSCGQLVYVDDILAGFVIYAPPHHLPGSYAFPTAPPSPDAVLLTTAYVRPDLAGGGLGRMLMQGAARDLARRGVHAIEAFGDARPGEPDWSVATGPLAERACVAPADYFRAVGFTTVSPHPRYPRLRLELRTAVSWRTELEAAVNRWLTAWGSSPLRGPALLPTARVSAPPPPGGLAGC